MPTKGKIIVLRFSAMGDVAMVASVLREFAEQHPQVELVMVSRKPFAAFFDGIDNLSFHPILPKDKHKGIVGLYQLYKELKSYQPTAIADLHDNLRSRVLSTFFRFTGLPIKRIDKGRTEKKALTRKQNKVLKQLKLTVQRYADVFTALGYETKLSHKLVKNKQVLPSEISHYFENAGIKKIGISPFAQHIYKVYPLPKMEVVIASLYELGYQLFIFGGGQREAAIALEWENKYNGVINTIGKFTLKDELAIISNLDLMLSMDSSGMHMASLMGTPVVSVWGPTHPFAGFLGYGQNLADCIQIDHPDRPNSIYGNKPCLCGVQSCIELIAPQTIVNKIIERVNNGKETTTN